MTRRWKEWDGGEAVEVPERRCERWLPLEGRHCGRPATHAGRSPDISLVWYACEEHALREDRSMGVSEEDEKP